MNPRFLALSSVLVLWLLPLSASSQEAPLFPEEPGPIPQQEVPSPLPSLSAQTCNACHGEIHDQWAASGHAAASTNPIYRAAVDALGEPALCEECHLPLMNQRREMARGPGVLGASARVRNPGYSPSLALEGVTCAACHVRGGRILGPRELPEGRAPHPVKQSEALRGPGACASCHQASLPGAQHAFLDTLGEWAASPFGEAGVDCRTCHMPRVSGVIAGSRYAAYASHRWTGNRDPKDLARGVTLEVSLREARVQRGSAVRATAVLMNTGAGHAIPTGDPAHAWELRFDIEDPEGKAPDGFEPAIHRMARTLSEEAPFDVLADDRLPAAGLRSFDFDWTVPKKWKAGRLHLVVTVLRWAVPPERAAEVGLSEDSVRTEILRRRIPIRFE